MGILVELVSGALKPDVYRCEALEEPATIKDVLAEKGWRDFYLDGRLIVDKQSLLKAIAEAMSFPAYVANNWDALEEAIRDLEWAPGAGYLVIYDYPQIFAAYQPQEWQTTLSILHSAVGYWRTQDIPMFVLLCKTEKGLADVKRLQAEKRDNNNRRTMYNPTVRTGAPRHQEDAMNDPKDNLSPIWSRYTHIEVEYGEGPYLYTTDGHRYLDFTCGIAVTNTGHCHPKVVAAAQAQVGKLIHGQINIVYHKPALALVQELQTVLPPHLDSYFFTNSGAEAIEAAMKLARHATGRTNMIVFQGGFHGRTIGSVSLTTSNPIYHYKYQPLMPGVYVAPFPDAYFYGWPGAKTEAFCLKMLRHLLASQTAPDETAAMLLEPVLGEGGYVVPPPGFLAGVEEICREHGILFIVDEVQSGFGRTGKWFAHQHFGVEPDIVVMAKALASGFPLSGIAARAELMQHSPPGSQGGTFGGNAVACAAGVATLRAMREEGMIENSARLGAKLIERLEAMQARFPVIGDIRGLGLMVGVEFTTADGEPDKTTAKAIIAKCLEDRLIMLPCGTYSNVIRWIPPLIIDEAQLDEALGIFENALEAVVTD